MFVSLLFWFQTLFALKLLDLIRTANYVLYPFSYLSYKDK